MCLFSDLRRFLVDISIRSSFFFGGGSIRWSSSLVIVIFPFAEINDANHTQHSIVDSVNGTKLSQKKKPNHFIPNRLRFHQKSDIFLCVSIHWLNAMILMFVEIDGIVCVESRMQCGWCNCMTKVNINQIKSFAHQLYSIHSIASLSQIIFQTNMIRLRTQMAIEMER